MNGGWTEWILIKPAAHCVVLCMQSWPEQAVLLDIVDKSIMHSLLLPLYALWFDVLSN
jgi:hypothetical protein